MFKKFFNLFKKETSDVSFSDQKLYLYKVLGDHTDILGRELLLSSRRFKLHFKNKRKKSGLYAIDVDLNHCAEEEIKVLKFFKLESLPELAYEIDGLEEGSLIRKTIVLEKVTFTNYLWTSYIKFLSLYNK